MKKITKEILTYIILLLLAVIFIILGVVSNGKICDILLNIGLSILATVIVYFMLKFCSEDPMKPIIAKVDEISHELTLSSDLLVSTKKTGIINSWNTRSDCSTKEWIDRIKKTDGNIKILCYAMSFLIDDGDFDDAVTKVANDGKKIEILLGDPKGNCICERTSEEENEGDISERINRAISRIDQINKGISPENYIDVKIHNSPLYASLYIFGNDMMITPQLYGERGALAPIIEVQKNDNKQCIYNKYYEMFNKVWRIGRNTDNGN